MMVKRLWWTFVVGYAFMSLWVPGVVARTRAAGLSCVECGRRGADLSCCEAGRAADRAGRRRARDVWSSELQRRDAGGAGLSPRCRRRDVVNGPVTVFGKPSGGWSELSGPGVFEPPAGEIATAAAAANGAVAVTERSHIGGDRQSSCSRDPPAAGRAAYADRSSCRRLRPAAVRAGGSQRRGCHLDSGGPIRVFAQPAGGWSGNVQQRAQNCRPLTARRCTAWPPPANGSMTTSTERRYLFRGARWRLVGSAAWGTAQGRRFQRRHRDP